jgi:hypothetical protein
MRPDPHTHSGATGIASIQTHSTSNRKDNSVARSDAIKKVPIFNISSPNYIGDRQRTRLAREHPWVPFDAYDLSKPLSDFMSMFSFYATRGNSGVRRARRPGEPVLESARTSRTVRRPHQDVAAPASGKLHVTLQPIVHTDHLGAPGWCNDSARTSTLYAPPSSIARVESACERAELSAQTLSMPGRLVGRCVH